MLVQTTRPTEEPVSLAEARAHLRIDSDITDEDALISMLITAARLYAESYTGRSFVTQGWRLVLDCFPRVLQLERGVVQSITSMACVDMAGVTQTITWAAPVNGTQASTDGTLIADLSGCPARVAPAFGRIWPIPLPQIGSVKIDYTAGYGDTAESVPAGIKQWILMRVNTLLENREEVAVMARGKLEPLPYIDALLDPYSVVLA